MKTWFNFWYHFWRAVGSVAIGVFHASQTLSHKAYLSRGKSNPRSLKPLTAIYKFARKVRGNA